jgi:hypothetical protein
VGKKRKAAEEKGKEHHLVAFLWPRDDFDAREDGLRECRKQTLLLGLCQIRF